MDETKRLLTVPPIVCLVPATDQDRLADNGLFSLPWQFVHSGLVKAMSERVADAAVVVDYRMAGLMHWRPPGRRVVVYCDRARQEQYPRALMRTVEVQSSKGGWKEAKVVYSVMDAFHALRHERLIYVLGGYDAVHAFWPYASFAHVHVLQHTIPGAHTSQGRAYLDPMPQAPARVGPTIRASTAHVAGSKNDLTFRVETYIMPRMERPPTPSSRAAHHDDDVGGLASVPLLSADPVCGRVETSACTAPGRQGSGDVAHARGRFSAPISLPPTPFLKHHSAFGANG